MLTLTGEVLNTYKTKEFMNKETGEVTAPRHKVQIICDEYLPDGEHKTVIHDFTVTNVEQYKSLKGSLVRVDVGTMIMSNKVFLFILKGSLPTPLSKLAPKLNAGVAQGAAHQPASIRGA